MLKEKLQRHLRDVAFITQPPKTNQAQLPPLSCGRSLSHIKASFLKKLKGIHTYSLWSERKKTETLTESFFVSHMCKETSSWHKDIPWWRNVNFHMDCHDSPRSYQWARHIIHSGHIWSLSMSCKILLQADKASAKLLILWIVFHGFFPINSNIGHRHLHHSNTLPKLNA